MIEVFYTSSVLAFATQQPRFLAVLDKDELATAERFKLELLRQRYIITHGLLRERLAEAVGESAASLRLEKMEFGKPFLVDYPGVSFNMSHSGDSLAVAIAPEGQLGIDIECYKPRHTWEGLVNKCFSAEESKFWYSLNKIERGPAFYQFWVKKEAFVKAVGKGITLGLNQCAVNPENMRSFLSVPEGCGAADQWQIHILDLSEEVFGAVVCDRQQAVVLRPLIN